MKNDSLRHIAFIMDGNRRWAKKNKLPAFSGHKEGLEAAKRIVKRGVELKIPYMTFYAFSTENWKRTEKEINYLMDLIVIYLKNELDFYIKNKIRLIHIGDINALPKKVRDSLINAQNNTKDFTDMQVALAINYGGRDEIIRAFNSFLKSKEEILTENNFNDYLDTKDFCDVDLLVRSSFEYRISNFLLWQISYAEFYFSDKLWPDWQEDDLDEILKIYNLRERRFGN